MAFDIYEHKLSLIRDNCRRLGINSVRVDLKDAREIGSLYLGQADYLLLMHHVRDWVYCVEERMPAGKKLEQIKELKNYS